MNNTKKTISCFLAVASITSVATNVNHNVNAKDDINITTEPTVESGKVSAVVLENEQGAVIRVTVHVDVQKVKTTYTVDGTQAKIVNFGNLTKGQVKDIQISFESQPAVKTVKKLPNTAVVSDRVEFSKTVKSHAIKGSVSFEYETTEVVPSTPVVPTVPTALKPTNSVKPVDSTKPITPTKPVDLFKPTKPVDVIKPAEPIKPVDTAKPTAPVKPVEKPTTPVGTQPKVEPTTPKEDNGTWKEETRTRNITVDEEYTENSTEDVFEEKKFFDDWLYLSHNGVRYQELGWYEDFTDDALGDLQLKIFTEKGIKVSVQIERKVREIKKVKVGTKVVPVTKVRKVQKQETYKVWVNTKTGEVRTTKPEDPTKPVEKPTIPTTPKEDNGTWKEEIHTRNITVDEEYTENTTEDVFEEKHLKERWIMVAKNDGTILANVGWESDVTASEIDDALIQYNADKTIEEERIRETKKVKVGTRTVPVTKIRKVQKQESYKVWVNDKTGEVRTERP